MSTISTSVKKLIDSEHIHKENSTEISNLLVDYLVDYINQNQQATYDQMVEILGEIFGEIGEKNYLYETEVDNIIIDAKEKTCDEKKLIEKGIVFSAEEAASYSEKFRLEHNDLVFSGLDPLKIDIMLSIRATIMNGDTSTRCYIDDFETVKWLGNLGFRLYRLAEWGHYRISW